MSAGWAGVSLPDMRLGPDALECPQVGEHVVVLQRPGDRGEPMDILITLAEVGSGPASHLHPTQVERFHVVRGSVEVRVGEELAVVGVGEEVTVPAATDHSFRALERGSQLRTLIVPGYGFEAALEDVYALFDLDQLRLEGPIDRAAVAACFAKHKDVMVSMRGKQPR